jgi:NADH:ubiquinone oxidoreductase subunit E
VNLSEAILLERWISAYRAGRNESITIIAILELKAEALAQVPAAINEIRTLLKMTEQAKEGCLRACEKSPVMLSAAKHLYIDKRDPSLA